MTQAQQRALTALWSRYVIEPPAGMLDLDALFGRHARHALEIGFGMGDALLQMALADPDADFLGIEVHRPGVGRLLHLLERHGLSNVRIVCDDAVRVLREHLANESLDEIFVLFPDPWPKKRHHKRRLIQPAFAELLRAKLRPGGCVHLATDWEDYAGHMLAVMSAVPGLRNLAGPRGYMSGEPQRPHTKFEQRGQRLGHAVWDLTFERGSD